jgi:hypothetical protein
MIATSKKICVTCVAGAVLLAGAFLLLPRGGHDGDALASPANPASSESGQTSAPDLWKNMPPDPLLPDGVSSTWLTRDGSK